MKHHVFYGDLNCPFCFAQNERIVALGLPHLVEWRGLEHMPRIPSPMAAGSGAERERLATELSLVIERAPEVEICTPEDRPNSRFATRLIAAASLVNQEKAWNLKNRIYRAFWLEEHDISVPRVVFELARQEGLPDLDVDRGARVAAQWQKEWEEGPFDRRLPAMRSTHGGLLLGLSSTDQLSRFLWLKSEVHNPEETCEPAE